MSQRIRIQERHEAIEKSVTRHLERGALSEWELIRSMDAPGLTENEIWFAVNRLIHRSIVRRVMLDGKPRLALVNPHAVG
jgi:hypothetical protein